ncbi:PilW family protein [Halomonas sp. H5]|uniref:PilW family protein n=1 Tax=Halomonas sp. H5 TaxID=3423910 RepID=UPI003D367439
MSIQEKPRCQKGFTLVELMVALVIGLLIVFGATQLFVSTKVSFNRMGELAERQESLRYFVDVVSLDIRSSGVENISDDNSGELELGYTTRTEDPYCVSGGDLVKVKYSYLGGEVLVDYDCGSGWAGAQPIVSGLEDADFIYVDSDGYVQVSLRFSPGLGDSVDDRSFEFLVANRESVTR